MLCGSNGIFGCFLGAFGERGRGEDLVALTPCLGCFPFSYPTAHLASLEFTLEGFFPGSRLLRLKVR